MDFDHFRPEPARQRFDEAAATTRRERISFTVELDPDVAAWFAALPDGQRDARDVLRFYMETNGMEQAAKPGPSP